MSTKLNKIVRRELTSTDRKGRPLIVALEPGDVLSFLSKTSHDSQLNMWLCDECAKLYGMHYGGV